MCRRVASAQRSRDCARIGSAKISAKRGPRQNEEADANHCQSQSSHCRCAALGKDLRTRVRPLRLSR
jgi:hypothetical protein